MFAIAVKHALAGGLLATTLAMPAVVAAAAPADGTRTESSNMRLVGYSDLQARTAYQPVIKQQGNRWIAYVGHHGDNKPQSRLPERWKTTALRSST
jgi:hypothetical protein